MTPLERCARTLEARLGELQQRIAADEAVFTEYRETAVALAIITAQLPGSRGELLTTAQMAERLNVAPKTLLKRARAGQIRPAMKQGKFIRWRSDAATGVR